MGMDATFFQYNSLSMIYAGFKRVGNWWNYQNVISPFYRLYYIDGGEGRVYVNGVAYDLTPGTLFLIPKFTFHSYECNTYMDHYYICFFDDLVGGTGIPYPTKLDLKVTPQPCDEFLVRRYIELNPNKDLQVTDPKRYDNDSHIYQVDTQSSLTEIIHLVESNGILLQLFSRFLTPESLRRKTFTSSYKKLEDVIQYVDKNLDQRILVTDMAELMFVTPEHFSRIFKKVIGMTPNKYVQMKRIQRAQALLLTTKMTIGEVAEHVGIDNLSQFTRLFKNNVRCSPNEYRARQIQQY